MLLSQLTNKPIYVGKNKKGVCRGIGISLKTQNVKHLLASINESFDYSIDFAVGTTYIQDVTISIRLSRFRSCFPKNCAKLFIGLPVFSHDGAFLGNVVDVEFNDFVASKLLTSLNVWWPVSCIIACSDAVILKKEQPYPIGQRIPAPMLFDFLQQNEKNEPIVTKPVLKDAVKNGALIKLTLSLPPFYLNA